MRAPEQLTGLAVPAGKVEERRLWPRSACRWDVSWPTVTDPANSPPPAPWSARVQDYSVTGIGIVLDRPLQAGTVLLVDLHDRESGLSQPLRIRIVHSTAQPGGGWLVGCSIIDED